MKIVAIIQARMGSTRLPGKVMKPLVGKPMIYHVVERMRRVASVDEVVVATSVLPAEAPLIAYLESQGIPVFRGDEQDVLARYYEAAKACEADVIVRITADCPLISPTVTGKVISAFLDSAGQCDYVSNALVRTFPRGLDTEVFSFGALEKAFREATAPSDREHVTSYISRQPDVFRLQGITSDEDNSYLRWTVDEEADLQLVRRIYEALYLTKQVFEYEDVLALLTQRPELSAINRHIRQKAL